MEQYWADIPIGKNNAITYPELCKKWGTGERMVRKILHDLSYYDNGDRYILIRSSHGKGFYKTDDVQEINRYRVECTNRAKRTFAPLRKIRRVLSEQKEREKC